MAALNSVSLIGNLGAAPEVKYMPNGDAVVNVNLATTEKWKDKSGEQKESTEWHRLVFFGRVAEIVGKYCTKGSPIYVSGKLKTRKWEKDGHTNYTTEVICYQLQLLGGKRDSEQAPVEDNGQAQAYTSPRDVEVADDIPF